jgi:integrase
MATPKKPPSRERVLAPAELVAIWHAAPDDDYGRILKLCILSGQRIGQWAGLQRAYIQAEVIAWPAEMMKGKRAHMLPLTDAVRALLPDRVGLLFPTETARPYSNWSRSKERFDKHMAMTGWTHHDLRRTWATVSAEELGTEPHIIEAFLAHAYGTQIARTYNRARYSEPMRKALLAFEEWLQTLLSTAESTNDRDDAGVHSERA